MDGENGNDTGGAPRWLDLGDSRDLAAAVRGAYQASPRPGPPTADAAPPEPEPDALALLRTSSGSKRSPWKVPTRAFAALAGAAIVIAAAVIPMTLLSSRRAEPATRAPEAPGAVADPPPTTSADVDPWTYGEGTTVPDAPDAPDVPATTVAPAARPAPAPTTTSASHARRTTPTSARAASGAGSPPAGSPPPTDAPPPSNDEPTSGW